METTHTLSDGKTLQVTRENRKSQTRLSLKVPRVNNEQLKEFCHNATKITGVVRAERSSSSQVVVTLVAGPDTPDRTIRPTIESIKRTLEMAIDRNGKEVHRTRSRRRK